VKATRGRILVIRGGAIGDFILTLPALTALRRQFPEAHVEVLGYPHIAQLALAGGLVDRLQPIEARALAAFFASGGELSTAMGGYFSEFNIILSYLYDPDGIFRANVARVSQAQFIAGPHRPDENVGEHATRVYLWPLERLAIFDADPVPRLTLAAGAVPTAAVPFVLAAHPGSGSEQKNWPEAKWRDFMHRWLADTPHHILLVGGEAEGDRVARLAAGLPPERFSLAQHLPLAELAARLAACQAFVGHDSGITHLAAALGLPCVALWGHTRADLWRPQGPGVRLLSDQLGVKALPVERVLREVRALVGA
jgi:heptosyltransferase-3